MRRQHPPRVSLRTVGGHTSVGRDATLLCARSDVDRQNQALFAFAAERLGHDWSE